MDTQLIVPKSPINYTIYFVVHLVANGTELSRLGGGRTSTKARKKAREEQGLRAREQV